MPGPQQRVLTVLVTDIEGSTGLRTALGDQAADRVFAQVSAAIDRALAEHGGSLVKSMGDGVLAVFESPRAAVVCAVDIQRSLGARAAALAPVRVGLNTGEVTVVDGDLAGEAVAAAARIAALATGGVVLVSEVVRQLAGTVPGIAFSERGRHRLKGFPERVRVFEAQSQRGAVGRADPAIVGRDVELGVLRGAVHAAAGGMGRAVLVEGEPGIGKTRLLREAAEIGAALGLPVLTGSTDELERDRPFRALLDAMDLDPTDLGGDETRTPSDGSDEVFVVVDQIIDELEQRCSTTPLVLVLEDVHWADAATVRTSRAIVRRLAHLPVALLVSFRTEPRPPHLGDLIDAVIAAGGDHLHLSPLADSDIATLVAVELGAEPEPALVEHLGKTGGNPLYALELSSAFVREGAVEIVEGVARLRAGGIPPELRLLILRHLSTLSPSVSAVLKTASVLGTRFSVAHLGSVLERPPTDLLQQLEEALRAGILDDEGDRLVFHHDLIREALYSEIPNAARRPLHRQVAERLIADGTPPELVAEHVALGATEGDHTAVRWLLDAATTAQRRSVAAAITLLRQARDIALPATPEHHEVSLALANCLVKTGSAVEAAELAREALARGADEALARRVLITVAVHHHGGPVEAAIECRQALGLPGLSPGERATVLGHLAFTTLLLGDIVSAETLSGEAVEESERSGDVYSRAFALQGRALIHLVQGQLDDALSLGARAIEIAGPQITERVGLTTPHLIHGISLLVASQLDAAKSVFAAGRERSERAGLVPWVAAACGALGAAHFLSGAIDDAVAEFETAFDIGSSIDSPATMLHVSRAGLDLIALARGEPEPAAAGLDRPTLGFDLVLWVRALRSEADGETEGATRLAAAAWSVTAALPHLFTRHLMAPDIVRLLRADDPEIARQAVESMEEAERLAPSYLAVTACALRCRGLLDDDPDRLLAAVDAYGSTERTVDRARCTEEAGDALARAGRAEEAVARLEEALAAYETLGFARFASRVQANLRALGVRRRRRVLRDRPRTGWESLSPTENEVVALVAVGLTNRQIGERLFISKRTVETHLTHVFAKLGVTSRAQVAARATAEVGVREPRAQRPAPE